MSRLLSNLVSRIYRSRRPAGGKQQPLSPRTARSGDPRHSVPVRLEELETREMPSGFWTLLANNAPATISTMMLLPDGTVMAQQGGSATSGSLATKNWFQLTPQGFTGNYINGTWSTLHAMNLERLYYASNVLSNDKVFVMGGEYSGPSTTKNFTNTGEIYDSVANTWSNVANFPQGLFGDDPSMVLPDGRILTGGGSYSPSPGADFTWIYNPSTNAWAQAATKIRRVVGGSTSYDSSDEEGWVKLSDGSILNYDLWTSISTGAFHAERYIPSTNQWVDASNVNALNPPSLMSSDAVGDEMGPGFLLPDGRAFYLGGNGHTAYYSLATNSWTAGPNIPSGLGADDAPGAMMPNGHILFGADTPLFHGPTSIFEFDPSTNTYSNVTPGGFALGNPSYHTRMLMLPSGQVLLSNDASNQLDVFTSNEAPSPAWRPSISSISRSGGTVTLTGAQLNGISEGAAYGDDAEMSSNYPLVEVTAPFIGNFYDRTSNWSSTGVAEGGTPESVQFSLGTGIDVLLHASGAGISSPTALAIEMSPSFNNVTLRVDPGNPADLEILSGGSFFDDVPFSSFSNIMVTCDSSADTLTVDYSSGNPIPGGGLNYSFGSGVDTLNVNDQTTSSNQTWTLGANSVQRSGSGPITFNGGINFVNVNGGTGNNTYNVNGTEPGWATAINANGTDVVNIGNGTLAGIQGSLAVENEPRHNTINIFDQNDSTAHTATIDTVARSGDTSLGRLQGVGASPITWDYFDTTAVNINFGSGTSIVNVLGTGVTTNLFNNGAATINVGNAGSVAGIVGTLNLENEPTQDAVNIFDQNDTTAHTATIDTVTRSGDTSLGRLTGIGAAPITWDYFDTFSGVNVNFGSGTSVVNVLGTGVTTTLFNNAFATINVGSGNSVAGIVGTLNLENEPSGDIVNINDQSDATAHAATIDTVTRSGDTSLGRLQGIGAAPITWDYFDTSAVNVNFGTGASVVNVLGTGVTTNLFNSAFATVNVGNAGSVAGIGGALNLENEPSADVVNINDVNDATFRTATVDTVTRSGDTSLGRLSGINGPITWDYFDTSSVHITFGSGGVTLTVLGTGVPTTVDGVAASVNTLVGADVNTTWNITGANAGNFSNANAAATFTDFRNLTGGAANDTFNFSNGASVSGTVNGGGGANTLNEAAYTTPVTVNLAASTATGVGGTFAGLQNFIGGSASNTLVGPNANTTWNITANNAGNLTGGISFTAFQNLTGGSAADTFVFADGAGVSGNIDGGGGTNMLDYLAYTTGVTVDLAAGTATGVGGSVANIQQLRGGAGNDTLNGNAAGTTTFFASPGNDTVTGAGGTNTLVGPNAANTWNITGSNAGTLVFGASTTTFSGVQILTGGSAADNFVFSDAAGVTGNIDGAGGANTLDYTAYTTGVTVNLGANTATGVGGAIANLQTFIGGSGANTLVGPNTDTTWNITGTNAGTMTGGISFTAFQNLTGGSGADNFVVSDGAGVSGTIDGGGGSNTLNEAAYSTAVTVDLQANTATGLGVGFANIQSFVGGSGANTLVGPNTDTTWNITGSNAGNLTGGISFTAFQNLTGGSGADAFVVSDGAGVSGTIDGGGGANTLNFAAYSTTVVVDLQTNTGTGVGGSVLNIKNVTGGTGGGAGIYNILVGNGGNVLTGGNGRRNLLIAGGLASTLLGGNDDDILIGGTTAYDTEAGLVSLNAIMTYWSGTADNYATRVNNVTNGIGVPLLDATKVTNNGGGNTLTGHNGGVGELNLYYGLAPASESTDFDSTLGEVFINC
jgi:hypothetical protein